MINPQVYAQVFRNSIQVAVLIIGLTTLIVLALAFTAPDPFYLAPFRESQTAISAEYLLREPVGGILAYQLPVLGAPWRIPYEFPLFQQLTAGIAQMGISVTQAGRLLNLIGFILCVLVMAKIWKAWNLPSQFLPLAVALFVGSPLYCIYATSHMIESLALLFALVEIWAAWKFAANLRWCWFATAFLCSVMAALVKITTWLPASALVGILGLVELKKVWDSGGLKERWRGWLGLFIIAGAGLLAGILWSKWCASIRIQNPIAAASESDVDSWVFGTLQQRLSLKNWILVGGKHLLLLFGPLGVFVPLLLAAALWKGAKNTAKFFLLLSILGYAVHTIIFFRLHLRHDYYVFGAGIFLISAVVFALVLLQEARPAVWVRWCPVALALSMMVGSLVYLTVKRGYHDLAAEEAIKTLKEVKEPGALLMFGFDWSARVPFAVGRKALMVTNPGRLPRALETNKNTPFAAAVVLGSENDEIAGSTAEKIGLDISHKFYFWKSGYILLPPGAQMPPRNDIEENPVIKELEVRVASHSQLPDGIVYKRLPFNGGNGGWFEIIVKRGADAFYVHNLSLIRVRYYFEEK